MTSSPNNQPAADVNSGTQAPAEPRVPDVSWVRRQRSSLNSQRDIEIFGQDLELIHSDLEKNPGHSVGMAVWWTLGAIAFGIAAIALGIFLFDLAGSMAEGLRN